MANKENYPMALPPKISSYSPSNKPALSRQRDHSACGRPQTPLKVRKTRENLKHCSIYADIPPPCLHSVQHCSEDGDDSASLLDTTVVEATKDIPSNLSNGDQAEQLESLTTINKAATGVPSEDPTPPEYKVLQRQRSVKRRMLSRVKQGLVNCSKTARPFQSTDSEPSLARRISGRRKKSSEVERRAQSFEISRESIDSQINESVESIDAASSSEGRSFTGSTVSTAEVLGDMATVANTPTQTCSSDRTAVEDAAFNGGASPSPQQTPRPRIAKPPTALPVRPPCSINVTIPSVALDVIMDCSTLDVHAKLDMWLAIKATVHGHGLKMPLDSNSRSSAFPALDPVRSGRGAYESKPTHSQVYQTIPSLRLCFKPVNGSRVRDVVGQKSVKDLTIGQQSLLFIKVRIPRIRVRDSSIDADQDSLFTELESIMGTLETEIMHVEARYRHPLLPHSNVVTVRHVCKLTRPKSESRWSMTSSSEALLASSLARAKLEEYLHARYPPQQALALIHEHLESETASDVKIRELHTALPERAPSRTPGEDRPSVVVTDVDQKDAHSTPTDSAPSDHFSTAPSTPAQLFKNGPWQDTDVNDPCRPSSASSLLTNLAPPLLSAPRTTTALSSPAALTSSRPLTPKPALTPHSSAPAGTEDTARQLWHHIRRSSLSARQLEEKLTPEMVEDLEAGDEGLRELRRKALANKRSVGAETLRSWKWEEDVGMFGRERGVGEAPWM